MSKRPSNDPHYTAGSNYASRQDANNGYYSAGNGQRSVPGQAGQQMPPYRGSGTPATPSYGAVRPAVPSQRTDLGGYGGPNGSKSPTPHLPTHRSSRETSREYMRTEDGTTVVKVRKKAKSKVKRRLIIAAVVVLALVGIGTGTVFGMTAMGNANLHKAPEDIQVNEQAVSFDDGRTIEYNGHRYAYNENMISICMIGYDRRTEEQTYGTPGQADAIMVLAMDTETGKTSAIAIPRNSIVEVPQFLNDQYAGVTETQICLAYSYGTDDASSSELVTTMASRVLYNMPVNYYYSINMQGIGTLADAIGGVSVTALQTIPGTNIYEGEDVILMGNDAIKYVQWRDTTNYLSPLDRQERQIQFVKALASQALTALKGNPSLIVDLFNTLSSFSTTNLGVSEVSFLASVLLTHDISGIDITKLEGTMEPRDYSSDYILDQANVYETVLNTYYTQLPDEPGSANAADNASGDADTAASDSATGTSTPASEGTAGTDGTVAEDTGGTDGTPSA